MKALATVVVFLLSTLCFAQSTNNQATPSTNSSSGSAQMSVQTAPESTPPAKPDDVKSMDSIMAAVYDVISGPAGQQRDWERFKSLFIPGARLIPAFKRPSDTKWNTRVLSPEEFATNSQRNVQQQGFFEREISRKTEQFGQIAQVFSTYESRHAANDPQPFVRGINSFQLLNDGQRWWIVTIYWQGETKDNPIPQEYLKK